VLLGKTGVVTGGVFFCFVFSTTKQTSKFAFNIEFNLLLINEEYSLAIIC
jgi:hypothetical protein